MVGEERMQHLERQMEALGERVAGLEITVGRAAAAVRSPESGTGRARAGRSPVPSAPPTSRVSPPPTASTSPVSPPPPISPVPSPAAPRPQSSSAPPAYAAPAPAPPHGDGAPARGPSLEIPVLQRKPAGAQRQAPRTLEDLLGGRSLEDLLGGRVLAWVGGLAVLIGIAFLFAVAVSSGWIGEGARTLIAGTGSAGLLLLGIWLHERHGHMDAALASVATGISALFVTLTVGAQVYQVLPSSMALLLALGVGALATGLAVRWQSEGIGALGILGGLISPVLAGAPAEIGTMAILLVAAASAVGVLIHQRWEWLSCGVFLVTVPQWALYLVEGPPALHIVGVLSGFGLLGTAAAAGYELRIHAEKIAFSSAFLLCVNATVLAAGGWVALTEGGHATTAMVWLGGLALAHVAIGLWGTRSRSTSHAFGLLALVLGVVLADLAFALIVDGPARAIGWAGAGVMFAALVRRVRLPESDEALTALGLGVHISLALMQAVGSDAPLQMLGSEGPIGIGAAISLGSVAAGCLVSARLAEAGQRELRIALDVVGLALAAYLTALTLDGVLLTLAWSVEAVALAKLASRTGDDVASWAARAHLFLAAGHAIAVVAPLTLLVQGSVELVPAAAALLAVTASAAACAWLTREEEEPEVRGFLEAMAMALPAYLATITLDGPALVVVWAVGAVALSEAARRAGHVVAGWGGLAYLGAALMHALVFEAPPMALVTGLEEPASAAISLCSVLLAAACCGRRGRWPEGVRPVLLAGASVTALYLASTLVVTPFQPGSAAAEASLFDLDVRQQGQVLLSALWSLAGFAALVLGLRRDLRMVRVGALVLLLVAVGKVFLFDLATLTSIYRVASFIGLGLFLLTAAFVWQRMRPKAMPDMRAVPEAIR